MTEQILKDKEMNDQMIENMRFCMVVLSKITDKPLKKNPEDYTVDEMLEIMEKGCKRKLSWWGRLLDTVLYLIHEPGFILVVLSFIIIGVYIYRGW